MNLIVRLSDTTRLSNPIQDVRGDSGTSYRFLWSETHAAHIFEGRELGIEEFNQLAYDLIARDCLGKRCIPVALESTGTPSHAASAGEEATPEPAGSPVEKLSVEEAFWFVRKNVRTGHIPKLARKLFALGVKKGPPDPPKP